MSRITLSIAWILIAGTSLVCAQERRQWPVELTAGRFVIHSDFSFNASNAVVHQLESVAHDVESLLRIRPNREQIHIVLFETDAEYHRYMRTYFPALPQRRALFIQDRGPGMLFTHWHSDVDTDLRHEVAHALLNNGSAPLPLWLDEGLAEYFEVSQAERYSDNPYHKTVCSLAPVGGVQSIVELSKRSEVQDFTDGHYRDSWAWVHFMIHRRRDTRELLRRYLQEHASGSESLDLERSLRQISPDLEREFISHFDACRARSANSEPLTSAASIGSGAAQAARR